MIESGNEERLAPRRYGKYHRIKLYCVQLIKHKTLWREYNSFDETKKRALTS